MHSLQRKVLRTICPDQKGLIARITNICYKHELNIVQNNEFVDHRTGRFFMRTELEGIFNDVTLLADLDSALPEGSIRELTPAGRRRIHRTEEPLRPGHRPPGGPTGLFCYHDEGPAV